MGAEKSSGSAQTSSDRASMSRVHAERACEHGQDHATSRFEERARKAGEQLGLIRRVLSDGTPDSVENIV